MRSPGTLAIQNSGGEVMAPLGSGGCFFRGKHRTVEIIAIPNDDDLPPEVREALPGVKMGIIFTHEQLHEQGLAEPFDLRPGMVLAYVPEMIHGLEQAGKSEAADLLRQLAGSAFDMVTLDEGDYRFLDEPETPRDIDWPCVYINPLS